MKTILFVAAAATAAFWIAPAEAALSGEWDKIAEADIAAGSTSNNLQVRTYNRYRMVRLCASAPVRMRDVRISFYGGDRQHLDLAATIPAGRCTAPIDLKGLERNISRLRLRHEPLAGGSALVRVEAR